MSISRVAILLAFLVGVLCVVETQVPWVDESRQEPSATEPAPALDHPWPPRVGAAYPDMELRDLDGETVRLSSLSGKVLLIHPIGTTSPGSIGFEGGPDCGELAGYAPQQNLRSIPDMLAEAGVPVHHKDLVTVHLVLYSTMQDPATLEQARAWSEHFGLGHRSNAVVLVGDRRYCCPETLKMIPGIQVVDPDFKLVADGGGLGAPHDIYTEVVPAAARCLRGESVVEETLADLDEIELPTSHPDHPDAAALYRLLADEDDARLEIACERMNAEGRAEGSYVGRLSLACDRLLAFPGVRPMVDAWAQRAPGSAYAALMHGEGLVDAAWEARGGGWASSVTEDGWRLFHRRLALADQSLARAAELRPDLALAPAARIKVSMGLADERWFDHFKAAMRRDPSCMKAHTALLFTLLPRWHGDEELLMAFVGRAINARPDDPAMQALVVMAHLWLEHGAARNRYLRQPKVAEIVDAALADLVEAYPASGSVWAMRSDVAEAQGKDDAAFRYRERAAELGHPRQLRELAQCYHRGLMGVTPDPLKARRLYCRAARAGDIQSHGFAGKLFTGDRGLPRNPEAALGWLSRGAELGDGRSMLYLGYLYFAGIGTERDQERAEEWVQRAAAKGASGAEEYLEKIRKRPASPR